MTTEPIPVDVQPLPEPAPDGFHGAVGQFTITTSLDNNQVNVNEPVTLKVEISGLGNFSNLPDPEMPMLNNWRSYESTSTVNSQLLDGRYQGSRVIEQLMVPGNSGEFTIPAISYTYFDPGLGDYQTVTSEPVVVRVSESQAAGLAPQKGIDNSGQSAVIQTDDIRHIKTVPDLLESSQQPLIASWVYWSLWLLPVGAVALDFAWRRSRRFRTENPELVRSSRAQKKASKLLALARKGKMDPYEAVGQALIGYLGDRFHQPVIGMTHTELVAFLAGKGVPPSLIKQVQETLTLSEMGRYAPTSAGNDAPEQLIKATSRLISRLEKALD